LLSKLSILFAIIGGLFLGASYIFTPYIEPLMATGFVIMFIGLIISFGAMFKKEQGKMKFMAVAVFFMLSFLISWNDPFQIIRLLTWIKVH